MLALLLATSSPTTVCRPEPKETSAREAVWNEPLARLSVLARHLPATLNVRLLIPTVDVQVKQVTDTLGAPCGMISQER